MTEENQNPNPWGKEQGVPPTATPQVDASPQNMGTQPVTNQPTPPADLVDDKPEALKTKGEKNRDANVARAKANPPTPNASLPGNARVVPDEEQVFVDLDSRSSFNDELKERKKRFAEQQAAKYDIANQMANHFKAFKPLT